MISCTCYTQTPRQPSHHQSLLALTMKQVSTKKKGFISGLTCMAKSTVSENWLFKKMTERGCLIEGEWNDQQIIGKFLMVKPNGNCFFGEQFHNEMSGYIFTHRKLNEVHAQFHSAPIIDNDLFLPFENIKRGGVEGLTGVGLEKHFKLNSLYFADWKNCQVIRQTKQLQVPSHERHLPGKYSVL